MAKDELRLKALDHMERMSRLEWTPSEDIDLTCISKTLFYKKGEKYYGVIYNTNNGHDYDGFKAYLDENNVFTGPVDKPHCPGNHCTSSIILSWRYVGDKNKAGWSKNMMPSSGTGILPVGDYVYLPTDTESQPITERNSPDVMYECYAKLLPADAILSVWATTGHARMVRYVEITRNKEGKIVPESSFVHTLEQTWTFAPEKSWTFKPTEKINTTWYRKTYSFKLLYEKFYIPITVEAFKE